MGGYGPSGWLATCPHMVQDKSNSLYCPCNFSVNINSKSFILKQILCQLPCHGKIQTIQFNTSIINNEETLEVLIIRNKTRIFIFNHRYFTLFWRWEQVSLVQKQISLKIEKSKLNYYYLQMI